MSLQCFDEALEKKIQNVFENTEIAHEEKMYSDAIENDAVLNLPIITIWRISNVLAFDKSTDARIRSGYKAYSKDNKTVTAIQSLPVLITYQIDIYSDRRREVDDIFKELCMFLYINDSLHVVFNLSDTVALEEDYTLKLIDNQSQTDFSSFDDKGRLYRETINLEIQNADLPFLKDSPVVSHIPIHQYVIEKGEEVED